MRILLAVVVIAALAAPLAAAVAADGLAQDMGGKGRKGHSQPSSAEQQQARQREKKAVDDAYTSAINRLPDSKEKYDPWRSAR